MKKVHSFAFATLTLPLILAACGTASTPVATAPTSTKLVKLALRAPAAGLRTQGLPTGASALHFDVHVRDSNNKLVAFNDGTFDPTGNGSTTLVLNSGNGFGQTLLLPAGQYTFENAAKDDATSATLLAYGPSNENSFTVSGDAMPILLKFHAVYDPSNSSLDFGSNMPHLFTNTTFNLNLLAKSSTVEGATATIPTSDLGPVTYTLGNSTDGKLNNAGSKLGVNVTSVGTPTDSVLDVHAAFQAWVRDGEDTASYQPVALDFSHPIETNMLGADVLDPSSMFNAVSSAAVGTPTALSGTATDNMGVAGIQLFSDMTLVASNNADDGVTGVTSDADGNWTTSWTPMMAGSHELTVVVTDTSGNETRSSQSVTAAVASYDHELNLGRYGGYDYQYYTLPAHSDTWVKVNTNGYTGYLYSQFYIQASLNGLTGTYGSTIANQTPMYGYDYTNYYGYNYGYSYLSNYQYVGDTVFYMHLKNDNDYPIYIEASSGLD